MMKKVWSGLAVLVLLIISAIIVYNNQTKSTIKGELTDFAIQDTAAIDRILMKNSAGEKITLDRTDNMWLVNGEFKARPDAMDILLTTMKKISVKSPVSQQAMNSTLKGIISNSVEVEVYDGDQLIKAYYVGGANQTHTGTNMLMKGSQRPFVMHIEGFHGFLTTRFLTNEKEWRHRGIFEYKQQNIASVAVSYYEEPKRNFSIAIDRINNGYNIMYGEGFVNKSTAADTLGISMYLKNYELIHYESYEETKDGFFIDSVLTSEPIFEIEVALTDGQSKKVKAFKKPLKGGIDPEGMPTEFDIDRMYLLIDEETFVIGQYAIFDKLTQGINFFKRG